MGKTGETLAGVVGLALILVFLFACSGEPYIAPRPPNVPQEAVYINAAKGRGFWQHCRVDEQRKVNWCRIYNVGGHIMHDEVFLRYSGDPSPVRGEQLRIAHEGGPRPLGTWLEGGPDWVVLENGEILLPKSNYDETKRFIDWLLRKRSTR